MMILSAIHAFLIPWVVTLGGKQLQCHADIQDVQTTQIAGHISYVHLHHTPQSIVEEWEGLLVW